MTPEEMKSISREISQEIQSNVKADVPGLLVTQAIIRYAAEICERLDKLIAQGEGGGE